MATPNQVKKMIETCAGAHVPVMLWGPPGVGKSAVAEQACKAIGDARGEPWTYWDERATQLEPVDLRGLPYVVEGRAKWARPEILPEAGPGILMLDELGSADPSVQVACYQLVQGNRIGPHVVPDDVYIMGAGNRLEDRAHAQRMSSALGSRLVHIDFDVSHDDWIQWALGHNIETAIIAYLHWRKDMLHVFDPSKGERTFPCPRTWESASRILAADPDKNTLLELTGGAIGPGAAAEFCAFVDIAKTLPRPATILANPNGATVPDEPQHLYATCAALPHHVDPANVDNFFTYISRLPGEFGVMAVKMLTALDDSYCDTRGYIGWAAANSKALRA